MDHDPAAKWISATPPLKGKRKAEHEYAQYHALLDAQPRAIDTEFEKVAKQLKKPAAPRRKRSPR